MGTDPPQPAQPPNSVFHTAAVHLFPSVLPTQLLTAPGVQREDYDLAARIRDDLTRERGVDVHQLKRQLDSAIDTENYIVCCLSFLAIHPVLKVSLSVTPPNPRKHAGSRTPP